MARAGQPVTQAFRLTGRPIDRDLLKPDKLAGQGVVTRQLVSLIH